MTEADAAAVSAPAEGPPAATPLAPDRPPTPAPAATATPAPARKPARPRARTRRPVPKRRAPEAHPTADAVWDTSPSRYIARVSRRTGKEIPGPISPEDLLVHAHRDNHPVEVLAQFLASRFLRTDRRRDGGERGDADHQPARGLRWPAPWARSRAAGAVEQGVQEADRRGGAHHSFQFREFTSTSRRSEVRARSRELQRDARAALKRARPQPAAARAPHRGHRLPGQGAPLPRPRRTGGSRRWWRWCDRRRSAIPETQERVKVLSPAQRGRSAPEAAAHHGGEGAQVPLHRRRHREARPGHRARRRRRAAARP